VSVSKLLLVSRNVLPAPSTVEQRRRQGGNIGIVEVSSERVATMPRQWDARNPSGSSSRRRRTPDAEAPMSSATAETLIGAYKRAAIRCRNPAVCARDQLARRNASPCTTARRRPAREPAVKPGGRSGRSRRPPEAAGQQVCLPRVDQSVQPGGQGVRGFGQ